MPGPGRSLTLTLQILCTAAAAWASFIGVSALGTQGPAPAAQAGAWAALFACGLGLGRVLGRSRPVVVPLLLGCAPLVVVAVYTAPGTARLPVAAVAMSWPAFAAAGAVLGTRLARLRQLVRS